MVGQAKAYNHNCVTNEEWSNLTKFNLFWSKDVGCSECVTLSLRAHRMERVYGMCVALVSIFCVCCCCCSCSASACEAHFSSFLHVVYSFAKKMRYPKYGVAKYELKVLWWQSEKRSLQQCILTVNVLLNHNFIYLHEVFPFCPYLSTCHRQTINSLILSLVFLNTHTEKKREKDGIVYCVWIAKALCVERSICNAIRISKFQIRCSRC